MNERISRYTRLAVVVLFALPLAACAATVSSKALEGKVLEAGTDKPIAGAIVTVRWLGNVGGMGHGGSVCYHVETTTSDNRGLYSIPAWKKPSPYGDIAHRHPVHDAYKPGYVFVRVDKEVIYLKSFAGTREERLTYLSRAARSCSDKKEIEINLLPLYKALFEEAKGIAVTRNDKLKVLYRLRDVERLEVGTDKAWENFRQRKQQLR